MCREKFLLIDKKYVCVRVRFGRHTIAALFHFNWLWLYAFDFYCFRFNSFIRSWVFLLLLFSLAFVQHTIQFHWTAHNMLTFELCMHTEFSITIVRWWWCTFIHFHLHLKLVIAFLSFSFVSLIKIIALSSIIYWSISFSMIILL